MFITPGSPYKISESSDSKVILSASTELTMSESGPLYDITLDTGAKGKGITVWFLSEDDRKVWMSKLRICIALLKKRH